MKNVNLYQLSFDQFKSDVIRFVLRFYVGSVNFNGLLDTGLKALAGAVSKYSKDRGEFDNFARFIIKQKIDDLAGKLSKRQRVTDSLDREIGEDGATRGDFIDDRSTESADAAVIGAETAEALKSWAATLTDQQRAILAGLQEGKSQTQIAEELGCTKQNVGQIVRRLRAAAEAAVRRGDPLFQSAKLSAESREALRGVARRCGLAQDPVISVLLGETDGVIRTGKGEIAVPFDGGGFHAIAKHLLETGKAVTGGVSLAEIAKFLPQTHEQGKRSFEKHPTTGPRRRKVGRGGVGRAVYEFTPEGQTHGYRLVTAVDEKGRELLVTFHSTLGENETKKATRSAISWQNANLPLGSRNNDNIHRQSEKSSVKTARGAILLGKFKQSYEAVMVLFAGRANTSTVVHESAHWLKVIMESLCEMRDEAGNFIATDQVSILTVIKLKSKFKIYRELLCSSPQALGSFTIFESEWTV